MELGHLVLGMLAIARPAKPAPLVVTAVATVIVPGRSEARAATGGLTGDITIRTVRVGITGGGGTDRLAATAVWLQSLTMEMAHHHLLVAT